MSLGTGSKFHAAMFFAVHFDACHQSVGADHVAHSAFGWETVEPNHHVANQMHDHYF